MSRPLLVLRPQPDADATAGRAAALGLETIVRPLFETRSLAWTAPDGPFDALMLTSAAAPRLGGAQLAQYHHLPAYAVGDATAAAARAAGFADIHIESQGVDSLIARMAEDDVTTALHLTGRDTAPHREAPFELTTVAIYEAAEVDAPELPDKAVALLHSTRAARRFASLMADRAAFDVIAISPSVAAALGDGWRSKHCANDPTDAAMLALAVPLCKD